MESEKIQELQLVVSPNKLNIPPLDWRKQSLRGCLKALGISDEEMRFNNVPIVVSWAGHIDELVDLVKKAWKREVVKVHEATGNDPHLWKMLNVIYSVAMRKLAPSIRKFKNRKTITFECHICGRSITKLYVSRYQNKSFLCSDIKCIREYRKRKARKLRMRYRITKEMFCEDPSCHARFHLTNGKGRRRYCSDECRINHWNEKNKEKIKTQIKARHTKRMPWKEWWKTLTPEQQQDYRQKHAERTRRRIDNETPEERAARLEKTNQKMKQYRQRRAEKGNPIPYKYIPKKEWLELKKEKLKDKPWLYETILRQFILPDGRISAIKLKKPYKKVRIKLNQEFEHLMPTK
jgi:hypothetical protein